MTAGRLPTGAKLDLVVLWAVGVLTNDLRDMDRGSYDDHLHEMVANKLCLAFETDRQKQAVRRSLSRLHESWLVDYDEYYRGWQLGPENE